MNVPDNELPAWLLWWGFVAYLAFGLGPTVYFFGG